VSDSAKPQDVHAAIRDLRDRLDERMEKIKHVEKHRALLAELEPGEIEEIRIVSFAVNSEGKFYAAYVVRMSRQVQFAMDGTFQVASAIPESEGFWIAIDRLEEAVIGELSV
jgi:hypothetical protein